MFKFSTSGHPHASHLCKYGTLLISKWQCMKCAARMKMTFAGALWERMRQCGSSDTSRYMRNERATIGSTKPQCCGNVSSKEPLRVARFARIIKTSFKATWQTTGEQCCVKSLEAAAHVKLPPRHLTILSRCTFN